MDAGAWGIVAVLVIGVGVIAYGWWRDRSLTRRETERRARPVREIPGLSPDAQAPDYVQETALAGLAVDQSATSADADLIARKDAAPTLPGGAAHGAFLNRAHDGLAVLAAPDVLVLDDDLTADRDATTVLLAAARRGRPLVLVAPYFTESVLGTLRANAVKGRVRTLPIPLDDPNARRRAVALSGGRLVTRDALASGWLPDQVWGSCLGWVCDLDDSWVLLDDPQSPETLNHYSRL